VNQFTPRGFSHSLPGHFAPFLPKPLTKAAIAEQRKFSALLKMLRAGLT
jgi:hypothetical protein